MAQFTVNPGRVNPYPSFKFRVKWDGRYVPGITRISGLRRSTQPIAEHSGDGPNFIRSSPGRTSYQPITLERGVTHDQAFAEWANKVYTWGAGPGLECSLRDFRKDVVIELCNEAGQVVVAWRIYRAWVTEYAIAELDASADALALEQITLAIDGFDRDPAVTEPVEPTL